MTTFESLGLQEPILKGIQDLGFVAPTPIQEKAIPVLLSGDRDFVGLAQTGTGKTAAFGLPLLQQLDIKRRQPQGLVLCPTRELCLQITNDLKNFSKHLGDISVVAVYGGAKHCTAAARAEKRRTRGSSYPGQAAGYYRTWRYQF